MLIQVFDYFYIFTFVLMHVEIIYNDYNTIYYYHLIFMYL